MQIQCILLILSVVSAIPKRLNRFRISTNSSVCETKTKQLNGYITVEEEKNVFFWLVESRSNPSTDPIILWLNGGPGASSMYGAMHEIGPCTIENLASVVWKPGQDGRTLLRPNLYSWISNATVIFVDQPLGTGFSYHSANAATKNSKEAARDMRLFLESFYNVYPKYKNLDLHLAGESYAGVYIPYLAEEIITNSMIKLNSIAVGNGHFDMDTQNSVFPDWGEAIGLWNSSHTAVMKELLIQCKSDFLACGGKESSSCSFSSIPSCSKSNSLFMLGNLNPYDVRTQRVAHGSSADAGYVLAIEELFRDPNMQKIMCGEVPFRALSNLVNFDDSTLEVSSLVVARLLERGIRVLIYAGEYDSVGTFSGQIAWMESVSKGFASSQTHDWKSIITSQNAGQWRIFQNFGFIRIYNAGHMVPFSQPEHSLEMIQAWIYGTHPTLLQNNNFSITLY